MSVASQIRLPMPLSKRNTLHFDLPIAQRLTLGFLTAAIIAGIMVGFIGLQRFQLFQQESTFYQHLLSVKSKLNKGTNLLEAIDTKTRDIVFSIGLSGETLPSLETLENDVNTFHTLVDSYTNLLKDYTSNDLLADHPDRIALLQQSNYEVQTTQQSNLAQATKRPWEQYLKVHKEILDILKNRIAELKPKGVISPDLWVPLWKPAYIKITKEERLRGEPLLSDTRSAMKSLQLFNEKLSTIVQHVVAQEEQYQLTTTIVGILFATIAILLIGLFISYALVYRVKQLRRLTQEIEKGKVARRIRVIGKDEIADISASINTMLEIVSAEQDIITASELKDQFIASVSHELRNPLTEVFGWLEILCAHHKQLDNETRTKFLNRAMHGCQELMSLINNVLDATRVGKAPQTPQIEEIELTHMVHTVLDHLDPRETSHYRLQSHVSDGLSVQADPQYVRQVLRNLLSNALKYSPKQSVIIIHALRQKTKTHEKPMIRICVKDTGPGIPPEQLPLLFQKFSRLPREKQRNIRGTGLGLYICKHLVEAMGGQIWVESKGVAGEGSCFYFTLPEAIAPTTQLRIPRYRPEQDLTISADALV